jgi:hypothetical protein
MVALVVNPHVRLQQEQLLLLLVDRLGQGTLVIHQQQHQL